MDICDGDEMFGTLTFPQLGSVALHVASNMDQAVKDLPPEQRVQKMHFGLLIFTN